VANTNQDAHYLRWFGPNPIIIIIIAKDRAVDAS